MEFTFGFRLEGFVSETKTDALLASNLVIYPACL